MFTALKAAHDLETARLALADIADLHACDPDGFCRADGASYPCATIAAVNRSGQAMRAVQPNGAVEATR